MDISQIGKLSNKNKLCRLLIDELYNNLEIALKVSKEHDGYTPYGYCGLTNNQSITGLKRQIRTIRTLLLELEKGLSRF